MKIALPYVTVVGTKPPRPHFAANQFRIEIWGGPDGVKLPVLRMRNDQIGMISVPSHEELTNIRNQIDEVLSALETGAASEAKGALDGILKTFDASKFKPEDKGGDSNA